MNKRNVRTIAIAAAVMVAVLAINVWYYINITLPGWQHYWGSK